MASVTERRILDASRRIAGPDKVPALRPTFGRQEWPNRNGKLRTALHVDGFSRAQRDAAIWRVPMVMGALQQMLSEVDWGELHRHAAGKGSAQLTMASRCRSHLQRPQHVQEGRYAGVRHVEDMTYFLCLPLCGRSEIFSHGARQKAEPIGTELHGEVLLDLKARETSDCQSAITVSEPDNPQVLVFRHIAGRICK
jgi:ATP-binding protein involved in chromosome partitioning